MCNAFCLILSLCESVYLFSCQGAGQGLTKSEYIKRAPALISLHSHNYYIFQQAMCMNLSFQEYLLSVTKFSTGN